MLDDAPEEEDQPTIQYMDLVGGPRCGEREPIHVGWPPPCIYSDPSRFEGEYVRRGQSLKYDHHAHRRHG